ncbi:mucin-3B-like [Penaeus japonicus]|uniref:mucin-3B-like n=1 Tax=Penaeus japonicus TaxID=27405 RepID=UPI001C712C98|nr:mucin-3B-like [Penaeus japonicus]
MASMITYFAIALGLVLSVTAQYETHGRIPTPVTQRPVTETVTRTETVTHTFRVTTTSDIWVTESTFVELPVTVYTTDRDFVPEVPRTVTSVLRVTTTPINLKTAEEFIAPVRTFVSVYTSFVTVTETVQFWQSIFHVSTEYQVQTVPVWTTQELIQHVVTTTTLYATNVVTSTTQGYHGF